MGVKDGILKQWVSLKGGAGVPPVNHAQDARATIKLIPHGLLWRGREFTAIFRKPRKSFM